MISNMAIIFTYEKIFKAYLSCRENYLFSIGDQIGGWLKWADGHCLGV